MTKEKVREQWVRRANRLNAAWLLTFGMGIIVVLMTMPFRQGIAGFQRLWVESPLILAINGFGFFLLAIGFLLNRMFFRHLRVRPWIDQNGPSDN